MRDIKFRGQNRLGKFVYGIPLLFETNKNSEEVTLVSRYIAEDGTEHQELWIVQKRTIGQYTGLKDKKGNEIYEGDILSGDDMLLGVISVSLIDGISYQKTSKARHIRNFVWDSDLEGGVLNDIEVVGNIHETPEMIEQ